MSTRLGASGRVTGAGGRSLVLLAVAACVAGCAKAAAEAPLPVSPVATQLPASVAGGACQLLDYDTVETATGVRFDVAAASRQGDTYTCVVQHSDASRPDLTLAVTTTTADPAIFRGTMVPKKARTIGGLGRAAYRVRQGQAVEVGWLSGDSRLIALRYTFPDGTDSATVDAFAPKLVNLAKKVDQTSV